MKFWLASILLALSATGLSQIVRHQPGPAAVFPLQPAEVVKAGDPIRVPVRPEYNFRNITLENGLSSNAVRKVWIDSKDNIWIGTNGGGVSIYDGHKMKYLTSVDGLSNDIVWDFEEDHLGRIWIGTDKGVNIYDGQSFEYIDTADGLGSNFIWSLHKDSKGRMWIGTAKGGLSIYEDGKLENHPEPLGDSLVQIYDIFEDSKGKIWMGCHYHGVLTYEDGEFEWFRPGEYGGDNRVTCIEETTDADGVSTMWFGTFEGLLEWRNGEGIFYGMEYGMPHRMILDLFVDNTGELWIANGLALIKWNDGGMDYFSTREGLAGNIPQSIIQDCWGNLWIGFRRSGLTKFMGERFTHYSKNTGLPGIAQASCKTKGGDLWFSLYSKGIIRFDGFSWTWYNEENGLKWMNIKHITEDGEGNIWLGHENKYFLTKFDGEKFYHYENIPGAERLESDVVELQATEDALWLGMRISFAKVQGDSIYFYGREQRVTDNRFNLEIYEDTDHQMWIGSFGGGVGLMKGDSSYLIKTEHGLSSNSIFDLKQDQHGNYWFANYGTGVSILSKESINRPNKDWDWIYLGMGNGLASNSVNNIFIQSTGDVWITTSRGLNKVILGDRNIFDVGDNLQIKKYSIEEGYTGIESNVEPQEDSDGNIWFASDKNVSKFNPRLDEESDIPPTPLIVGIKVGLKEVRWDEHEDAHYTIIDRWNNLPSDLSLPYELNHLNFEFSGVSFADEGNIKYSWKLEGFDQEWSPWSQMRNATYANLPAGTFTLQLRTKDSFGNVSDPIEYGFEVRKPFWQQWSFRIAVLILSIIILLLLYRWRTLALIQRQKELEKKVDLRTAEIKLQKEEIEHQKTEILDSIGYAKRIQNAILPTKERIEEILPNSFILYRPKDIVAGDFYWVEKTGNYSFFAAADCTGHGVPGAMVSVVCSNALNQAVIQEGIVDPGKILDRVRELVIEQFDKGDEDVKDGMDIALCRLSDPLENSGSIVLEYAGAHNSLLKFDPDLNKMQEVKADRQPVGQFQSMKPFTTQTVEVKSGDRIFLFSDGYADQFGGEKGKKLKKANFYRLITDVQTFGMQEQYGHLLEKFENWRGDIEQLDDVCIIGVEL